MKLKYTGTIEIEPFPLCPDQYIVRKGTALVPSGQVHRLEYYRSNFTPADNDALNTLDPDRTERLCQPIIGG